MTRRLLPGQSRRTAISTRASWISGRIKWVIKPQGYKVFPGQAEDFLFELRDKMAATRVVGVEHTVFSEAIIAFVEKKLGSELSLAELEHDAEGDHLVHATTALCDPGAGWFAAESRSQGRLVLLHERSANDWEV